MNCPRKCCLPLLAATIAAIMLRLPHLEQRPMHVDEAVHAVKFGQLLEKNFYRYNPHEYHGPTLNYFTLIPAWLSGAAEFKDLSEFTLRIVPVFFSLLLVLMPLLFVNGIGWPATIIIIGLTATSPAFVFYSRYYIHETLLVCFTFGVIVCGYRYTQNKNLKWVLLCGIFLGLMHATKETCIIALGSMLLALLFTLIIQRNDSILNTIKTIIPRHIIVMIGAALIISALFYSSFFTNPHGIIDSFVTYTAYFQRASQNQLHIHPWYYYLDILTWMEGFEKLTWNEDFIVVLAGVGFIVAMTKKGISPANYNLLRFLAFYTLIMTIIYSAIPYKTPWSMLSFLHGMILLAGIGCAALIKLSTDKWQKVLLGFILAIGLTTLPVQAYLGSFHYYADPSNPYVYAHTGTDVFNITRQIEEVAQANADGHNIHIQVICPKDDYWPLPWYLRSFPNVGWWNDVDQNVPAAPIIIASPSVEPALIKKLYELPPPGKKNLYVPLFDSYTELRPQVELRGFITKDLWDNYQQLQSQPVQQIPTDKK
ncbi:MAG: hypothetical protein AMJ43_06590 [Coxiella sp. DG_40]|nr:MAG: hypothetical protein AMJ43_06590 [Coxiella sp. DG_40]